MITYDHLSLCFFLADRKSVPSASTMRPELLESCYDAAEGDDVEDLEEEGGLGYFPNGSEGTEAGPAGATVPLLYSWFHALVERM